MTTTHTARAQVYQNPLAKQKHHLALRKHSQWEEIRASLYMRVRASPHHPSIDFPTNLQRAEERNQLLTLFAPQGLEGITRALRLSSVPQDNLLYRSSTAIIEKSDALLLEGENLGEAYAPQRWRAPLLTTCGKLRAIVLEANTHFVQEKIGISSCYVDT